MGATTVAVQVATGTGRLCRTEQGVLYVPQPADGWEVLVDAARAAAPDDGIAAVATALAERELDAPAFVYVTWQPRVAVLVFGDVELRTDQRTVPMLTGASSQTWVEHSVPAIGGAVELFVTPPEDEDTDLAAGIVPAGGFRLQVDVEVAAGTVSARPAADADATEGSAPSEPTTSEAATVPLPAVDAAAPVGGEPTPPEVAASPVDPGFVAESGPEPERDPAVADGSWRPPGIDTSDPDAALGAIQAAAVPDEDDAAATDAWAPPTGAPVAVDDEQDVTSDGPTDLADTSVAVDPRSLVEAVVCSNGHPNPPGRGSCRSCDGLIAPGASVSTVPRPSLGHIELDVGTRVDLSEDLVLGRRPDVTDGGQAITVDGDRVSRTHAELSLHSWEIRLRDCGSRNGTYVQSQGSDELVKVEPDVAVRLESGATVYLGTRSFTLHSNAV